MWQAIHRHDLISRDVLFVDRLIAVGSMRDFASLRQAVYQMGVSDDNTGGFSGVDFENLACVEEAQATSIAQVSASMERIPIYYARNPDW